MTVRTEEAFADSFCIYKPAAFCGTRGLSELDVVSEYLAILNRLCFHELVWTSQASTHISGKCWCIRIQLYTTSTKLWSDNQIVHQKDVAYSTKWLFGKSECNLLWNKILLLWWGKKKTEKKKEPGQHCTVWNFQRDFAFTVCSMKVRFHFSHERSISKYCSCYNRLLISQWSRSFRDLGYKISRLSDKCGLNIVIINFRMKTTLKILFFSFFLWKTSFSSSFYIHSSYMLYVDIRCCQPFA